MITFYWSQIENKQLLNVETEEQWCKLAKVGEVSKKTIKRTSEEPLEGRFSTKFIEVQHPPTSFVIY